MTNLEPTKDHLWSHFTFINNVPKMRNALLKYLAVEGVEGEVDDGDVVFCHDETTYRANFDTYKGYAEIHLIFELGGKELTHIDPRTLALMANSLNSRLVENHTKAASGEGVIVISNSFFFTSRKMMLNVFLDQFNEMVEAVKALYSILSEYMSHCERKGAPAAEEEEEEDNDGTTILGFGAHRAAEGDEKETAAQKK